MINYGNEIIIEADTVLHSHQTDVLSAYFKALYLPSVFWWISLPFVLLPRLLPEALHYLPVNQTD